jgi:hypothetical protein
MKRKRRQTRVVSNFFKRESFWSRFAEKPWSAPKQLRQKILLAVRKEDRIWLSNAVNLMAFGSTRVPDGLESVHVEPQVEVDLNLKEVARTRKRGKAVLPMTGVPLEEVARKQQAARAPIGAVQRGSVRLIGTTDEAGDESDWIPSHYFDMPRCLGHADNSIETDLGLASIEVFVNVWKGHYGSWFNVRVDGKTFRQWIAPPAMTEKQQKRSAVFAAIESRGPEILHGALSKTLEAGLVDQVKADTDHTVSDRLVRGVFSAMKRGT